VSEEKTGSNRGRWTRRQFVRNTGLGALAATGLSRGKAAFGEEQGAGGEPRPSGSGPGASVSVAGSVMDTGPSVLVSEISIFTAEGGGREHE